MIECNMILTKFILYLRDLINTASILKLKRINDKEHKICNIKYNASIYGYNLTSEYNFDSFKIIPKLNDHDTVNTLSSDSEYYNLTGYIEFSENFQHDISEFLFNLQAILSFIDQRDVLIILHKSEVITPVKLNGQRLDGGGEVIGKDCFFPGSRKLFIEKSIQCLYNTSDSNLEIFKSAFFKTIEVFRSRKIFIEISYFLLFSALESLSRAELNDYTPNSAAVISKYLQQNRFDIKENNIHDLKRATISYAHVRNSLFHNAFFEVNKNINGQVHNFKISVYLPILNRLLPLVIMKYIGFDDGHINWDSWIDRQPFI